MSGERKSRNPKGRPPRRLASGELPVEKRATYSVRLLAGMRKQLLEDAAARGTSLSGQIEYILQQWYNQPELLEKLADILDRRRITQERARLEAMLPKSFVLAARNTSEL